MGIIYTKKEKKVMKKLLMCILVIITALMIILPGCSNTTSTATSTAISTTTSTATTTSGPKYGGTFTLILNASPGGNIGYPPEFMGGDSTTPQMIYEGLMRGLSDGSNEPMLATSWELAADHLSCVYHLRQGVKFHDGTDFNAAAVKLEYDVLIAKKLQVYWSNVEAVDDYTIKITFKEYRNGIEFSPAGQWIPSPTAVAKDGSLDYIRKNPCGTGPFIFVSFQQDESFVAKKNPNYWVKGKPYIDEFKILYIPDDMTIKAAMQKGTADAYPCELGKMAADFIDLDFKVLTQHQAVFTIFFDSKNPDSPFANIKVREAIEYAINKDNINKNLGYGLFVTPKNIIPIDNVASDDTIVGRSYDPAKAKALLAEAGFPNGFITQITPHVNADKDINLAIQQDLAAVGIDCKINYVPDTQYLQMRTTTWDGMMLEPFAGFANFGTSLSMYLSQTTIYFPYMDKPDAMQQFLNDIAHSTTYPNIELIRGMVRYINDNALVIPVYDGGKGYALSSRTRGNAFLTLSFPPYFVAEEIWLEE
jgi:peptide/nickel transport system substrate-binding protein